MISANGGLPAHRYTPQVTPRWPRGSEPASIHSVCMIVPLGLCTAPKPCSPLSLFSPKGFGPAFPPPPFVIITEQSFTTPTNQRIPDKKSQCEEMMRMAQGTLRNDKNAISSHLPSIRGGFSGKVVTDGNPSTLLCPNLSQMTNAHIMQQCSTQCNVDFFDLVHMNDLSAIAITEAGSDPRGHLGVTWGVYLCAGKPPLADIILSRPPELTRCDSVIGLAIPALSGHIQYRGAASGDLYIGISGINRVLLS